MRKAFIILTGILFTLLCATCKQFTADIDGYLSYWSSEAFIRSSAIDTKTYNDGSGIVSVASTNDVTVTLKVQNPKSFRFVMPSASETRNIVGFARFDGTKPAVSADYELKQPSADTLQLVYKTSFLKNAEWGEKDVSSTITLYANDGREFKQTFTVPLKVNTPPPNPGFAVIKTKDSPAYYVLCFTVPDMDKTVPGGLLHKDLARIEVNGTPYTFSVNEAQTAFTKPEAPVFITHSDVEKLNEPEADDVPADSSWVLYYKTDVEVKAGAAKKDYTIKLIDKKGLASGIVNASTKPNKAETEIVRITKGTEISGSGSSESDPTIIGTDSSGAEIRVSSGTANTMVHCTLTNGSTPVKYDGNPVTVPLPLNGAGAKQYKLEYYTDGEGFAATPVKTIYYRVVQGHTVTFDANEGAYPDGAATVSKTALHGTKISPPDPLPKKQGYGLTGWSTNAGTTGIAWNFDTDIVTGDITLYAQWTEGVVSYTVQHYKEELDGSYPETPTETEGKTGTTDASISANSIKKSYEGFDFDHIEPIDPKIGADGKTVVKLYYKRKTYAVHFNVDGPDSSGTISVTAVTGGSVSGSPVTVKHGGSVSFKATPAGGWEMKNWTGVTTSPSNSRTATLSNVTSATTVTVKFYQSKIDGTAPMAWRALLNAVKDAPAGATLTIRGTIQATNHGSGDNANYGKITIDKDLTIKGEGGAGILDANQLSPIFIVQHNKTFTLDHMTLKNGKKEGAPQYTGSTGCGVYTYGTFNMQDSTITNCEAVGDGGGVYVTSGGTCIMKNSTITGCTATMNGGGVCVDGGTFKMQGSSAITGCTASKGGGVYVSSGTFKMQDSAIVTPSTGSEQYTAGKNDVYLESGQAITVDGTLSNNPAARITPESYRETPVLTGNITGGSPQNRKKFTVPPQKVTVGSENGKIFWYISATGLLKAEVEDLETLKEAIDAAPADDKPFIIKLAGTIDDLQTVQIPGHKKIMLKADNASNPAILKCPKKNDNNYKHLQVERDATLILEGLITLQGADYGSNSQYALYVEDGGNAEIKDGVTITGFKNTGRGTVFVDGNLTMSGGTITGNKAGNKGDGTAYDDGKGGGVYIAPDRSFTMTGGTIAENEAGNGGGVYVSADGPQNIYGNFIMKGGTIKNNKATKSSVYSYIEYTGHGGGVCTEGNFTMKGGTITGNQSTGNCKAVQAEHDFYWTGGDIKDNKDANQADSSRKAVADRNGGIYYFHNNTNPRKEPS